MVGVNHIEISSQSAEEVNQLIRDHRHRCNITIEYDVAGEDRCLESEPLIMIQFDQSRPSHVTHVLQCVTYTMIVNTLYIKVSFYTFRICDAKFGYLRCQTSKSSEKPGTYH